MKTKVNEVPLVGPKGRKELLARINELEEKIKEVEISMQQFSIAKPIILSSLPYSTDTLEDLADYGLTINEIKEAARGNRTSILYGHRAFFITKAEYSSDDNWIIAFEAYSREDDGAFTEMSARQVSYLSPYLTIIEYEV